MSQIKITIADNQQLNSKWCQTQEEDETATDECNIMVRNNILREGKFYIVQTKLNGRVYLRVSLMNPFTNADDLRELLDTIKKIA